MKRYIKIYLMLLKINLAMLFAYRANFFNSIISSIIWSSFVIILMILLTSKTSHVFGWTRSELLVLAGMYNVIYSVFYFFFSLNFEKFSETIHYGRLDNILTKPIDSQFLMTCWYIGFHNIIRLTFGTVFTIYILLQMHIHITLLMIFMFIILLIMSIIILYSFWLLVMTLIIWFTRLSNLVDLLYQINNVMRYPQEMYKGSGKALLVLIFPLTFIVVSPAKALLQKILAGDILWPLFFSLFLFFLARKFWKFALRFYTSASS